MQSKLPDKLYYSIGEVASAFEVNTSLIRFWEKEFDILKPKKNAKGDRKFSKEDVANLELIYHLVKVQGFTLDGAKIRLKENKQKVLSRLELIKKLEWVKVELQKIKNEL
ncbi:MAG: MerR family transcriptional regulator [Bacteroidetes bacterium]|jgi:DNA-binding transcriptional MerR regulator|nr:MerR family transcriptional regulator [Bacteroidota bacterium]